jgi:hypothetical protein
VSRSFSTPGILDTVHESRHGSPEGFKPESWSKGGSRGELGAEDNGQRLMKIKLAGLGLQKLPPKLECRRLGQYE